MKLFSELFAEMLENDKQPMYVAVRPDPTTITLLNSLASQYNVPNPLRPEKMHCTLIYSRTPTIIPQVQVHRIYKSTIEKFDIFNTRDGKRCLVAKLRSTDLQIRHNELMTELEASYDFPSYLPHITLSYDVGPDFDINPMNVKITQNPVYLMSEYYEILDDLID